jgi:hypothetical protein
VKRALLTSLCSLLIAASATAYTLQVEEQGGVYLRLHWPAGKLPLLMEINDQTGPHLPNVAPGSDPYGAVVRALNHWQGLSAFGLEQGSTSIISGGKDGHNVITFVDTPANRQALEMSGGPLALTLNFFLTNGEFFESDIIFNPSVVFSTTVDSDTELDNQGLQDTEAVATHELGHVVGLHHTGVESATMWPLASVLGRALDADDIAGTRTLYPSGQPGGTISGSVTVDGQPAVGAHVVALNAHGGVAASALTLPNGTYAVEGLPPDTYTVYVEPLDGPHAAVPDADGCVRVGNLTGTGVYDGKDLTTNFPTGFSGGNDTPARFQVASGSVVPVNFALPSGIVGVNPIRIGPVTVTPNSMSFQWFTTALRINAGAEQWVTVAGPNLDQVPATGISFSDPSITIDTSSLLQSPDECGGPPPLPSIAFPYLAFRTTIAAGAVGGGRSLFFRVGSQLSALTGGVRVHAATPPCVGDCNTDHGVTIDEILAMVNIALGGVSGAPCPAGDASHDGQITVDEILTAVHHALNGCPSALS